MRIFSRVWIKIKENISEKRLNAELQIIEKNLDYVFGFIVAIMGFADAVNAGWCTSFAIRGFSKLLFGISCMLFGNVLVTLPKK